MIMVSIKVKAVFIQFIYKIVVSSPYIKQNDLEFVYFQANFQTQQSIQSLLLYYATKHSCSVLNLVNQTLSTHRSVYFVLKHVQFGYALQQSGQ
jgi:hydrogenase maturation factor